MNSQKIYEYGVKCWRDENLPEEDISKCENYLSYLIEAEKIMGESVMDDLEKSVSFYIENMKSYYNVMKSQCN